MFLHSNKKEFHDTIIKVANELNISSSIIEKDYYVTLFLNLLTKKVPSLVFKGGTSLSKCYKIINRFSEDIDLTLDINNQSQGNKRHLKYKIIETCEELGFKILNINDIRSRRDYNKYEIEYPVMFEGIGIKQYLLVETVFMVKSYPHERKNITSLIYDCLKESNNSFIEEYNLKPFEINVQTLERTLVDKVFAICDYAISKKINGYSRHIYDIHKLLPNVNLDNIKPLFDEVKQDRKNSKRCYSAINDLNITNQLIKIYEEKTYLKDYNEITRHILYDDTNYETAIKSLKELIDLKIFE